MENSGLIVAVLLATVLLRLVLVLGAVWLLVPLRHSCPRCGAGAGDLARVRSRLARLLRLERRWCLTCGWEGVSKPYVAIPLETQVPTERLP